VNLLLSSVLRQTAEAYGTVSVATHSDKLRKCGKLPFRSWISRTRNLS